jgi:hypothetical protein
MLFVLTDVTVSPMKQISRDAVKNCTKKAVCHSKFSFSENLRRRE